MLNDYKGEKPNNVITEEEHKKRPFYKKVSFWVLSALGLFFGGCSVYGLVLGYQYVHAVTEAAHIIADANSSSDVDVKSLSKNRSFAQADYQQVVCLDLGDLNWSKSSSSPYYYVDIANLPVSSGFGAHANFAIDRYTNYGYSDAYYMHTTYQEGAFIILNLPRLGIVDKHASNDLGLDAVGFKNYVTGLMFYYRPVSTYTGESAYEAIYGEGHQDGYQDGYQEGYDDGSDAINLPQSVKVLLPVGNEYSVQYKSYVDGVVDRQGQLNSSQTGGAYATFDRSRNQKLRIDLTLPSGSRAFFLYTPSWTSAYPTDENYSLRQSWAVSGVTYLPTWISKPQIYVGVTSADVPDLTYETISVAFDVDHWGDIKVGAYSQGYNDGYQAGQEDPFAYDSGYDAGYAQGYDDGHTLGVAQGESQAVSGQKALVNMFVTAFQQPFDQIYRFLNFNVLGLNILALFTALLTLSIGIIIIKKVI